MSSHALQSQTVSGEIVSLSTFSDKAIRTRGYTGRLASLMIFFARLNPQPSSLRGSSEGSSSLAFCVLHVSVSFIFAEIKRLLVVYCTYTSSFLSSQRLSTLHLYGCKRIRNTSDLRLLNPALSIEC